MGSSKCGSGIKVNDTVAMFVHGDQLPSQVLCTTPCRAPEKYYFEIEITKTHVGAINIGLSSDKSNFNYRCGYDRHGWSYSVFSGTIYHSNTWKEYTYPAKVGDRIGIAVDMQKKCVLFFKNGQNQGVAISHYDSDIPNELYPSVSLADVGDLVSIVRNPVVPNF